MELNLEEVQLLIAGTVKLENEYRRKDNDMHGQPVTNLRKHNRAKLKAILDVQRRLILHKYALEDA